MDRFCHSGGSGGIHIVLGDISRMTTEINVESNPSLHMEDLGEEMSGTGETDIPQTNFVETSPSGEIQFRLPHPQDSGLESDQVKSARERNLEKEIEYLHKQLHSLKNTMDRTTEKTREVTPGSSGRDVRVGLESRNPTSEIVPAGAPTRGPINPSMATGVSCMSNRGMFGGTLLGEYSATGSPLRGSLNRTVEDRDSVIGSDPHDSGREDRVGNMHGRYQSTLRSHGPRVGKSVYVNDNSINNGMGPPAGLRGQETDCVVSESAPARPLADGGVWNHYSHRTDLQENRPVERSGHGKPPKNRKPATYDGKTSWLDYLVQFEMVASLNKWDAEEMACELAVALRGTAQGVLSILTPEQRVNYQMLVNALTARFHPDNLTEIYKAEIKGRLRKKEESLPELAQDIKRLVRMAYPNDEGPIRDQLMLDCYIDSLNDSAMEWAVQQRQVRTIDEAVRASMEYESFQLKKRKFTTSRAVIRSQTDEQTDNSTFDKTSLDNLAQLLRSVEAHNSSESNSVNELIQRVASLGNNQNGSQGQGHTQGEGQFKFLGKCFYCKKDGHKRINCYKRKADEKRNTPNSGN